MGIFVYIFKISYTFIIISAQMCFEKETGGLNTVTRLSLDGIRWASVVCGSDTHSAKTQRKQVWHWCSGSRGTETLVIHCEQPKGKPSLKG